MGNLSKIKESIKNISAKDTNFLFYARVKEVKGCVCTIDVDGLELSDVRLCLINDTTTKKIIIKPKKGSEVLVLDLSFGKLSNLVVCSSVDVDSIYIDVADDIVINGGGNDGLVKIRKLEENLENIKTYLGSLNTAIATGLGQTIEDGGGTAATNFTTAMQAVSLEFEDMENEKVKH